MSCSRARTYGSVLLAGAAAARRYLDFDRAVFVRWDRGRIAWVRIKYDTSRMKAGLLKIELNPEEVDALSSALVLERPVRLAANPTNNDGGLLATLGADTLVAAPVNQMFETPTFLLMDRSLTGRPVLRQEDLEATTALSSVFTMLADNLLLRLQRIRAQRSALSDPLTRLANRRTGILEFEREFAAAKEEGRPLTLLMLDLDDFKQLNDTYGHMVGDRALQLTARTLRSAVRRSDVVCRYGGEEFLAVLPRTDAEDAAVLAARLYTAVEETGTRYRLPVTISIGAASLQDADKTPDDLLLRADRALYASKNTGRNRFSLDAD